METIISRRSAMGLAAVGAVGAMAGAALAKDAASGDTSPEKKSAAESAPPASGNSDSPYKYRMADAHRRVYGESSIREHKLKDFPMSASMSASLITLAPGDIREPHWHPNSDEWLFVMEGEVRTTIVDGHGHASQFDCGLEDVAFTPMGFGHYVESIGERPARLMLIHNNADFTTVNLSEWVAAGATSVFASILNMPGTAFDHSPTKKVFIGPKTVKG